MCTQAHNVYIHNTHCDIYIYMYMYLHINRYCAFNLNIHIQGPRQATRPVALENKSPLAPRYVPHGWHHLQIHL